MFRYLSVVLLTVALASAYKTERCKGRDVKWTGGNSIDWSSQILAKAIYKNTGNYVGKNILATRTAIYRDDAIVTLPRYSVFFFINNVYVNK